jgi:hypothetical protein
METTLKILEHVGFAVVILVMAVYGIRVLLKRKNRLP